VGLIFWQFVLFAFAAEAPPEGIDHFDGGRFVRWQKSDFSPGRDRLAAASRLNTYVAFRK
jgi:hypothetical protein